MRQSLLCILLLLIIPHAFGQHQNKDSLLYLYHHTEQDTVRISALKWLAWHYYFKSSDSSAYYVEEMISQSKKSKFTKGLIDAYNIKGILYYTDRKYNDAINVFDSAYSRCGDQGFEKEKIYALSYAGRSFQRSTRFEKADSCFLKIISIALNLKDSVSIAKGYKSLAQNYSNQGDVEAALTYHFKADTFMINDISIDRAENYHNIGIIYKGLENHSSAIVYYKEALKIYRKIDGNYGESSILASLGSIEYEAGNYLKAKDYLLKAHEFFINYNDPRQLASVKNNLGRTEIKLGNYELALELYNAALTLVKDMEGSVVLSNVLMGLGETHGVLNNVDLSVSFYEKALKSAYKLGEFNSIALAQEAVANAYYRKGDYQKAFEHIRNNQNYKDSINTVKSDQVIHELGEKYQNEKKQQEIELLSAQNLLASQQKKNQLLVLVAVAIGLALLSVFLFILYSNRKKTAKKLKELDATKSNFFANISHEFRTPLTLIKSPVEDQLLEEGLSEHQRQRMNLINNNADRLLSLVDQLLDLAKLEAGSFKLKVQETSILPLFSALTSTYEYVAKQKGLGFEVNFDENLGIGWVDEDVLDKVLSNLLFNAIKYAKNDGNISLSAKLVASNIDLIVQNSINEFQLLNTEKMFDRFERGNEVMQGTGIGLALVKELIELHKGRINAKQEGTDILFEVVIPIHKNAYLKSERVPILHGDPISKSFKQVNVDDNAIQLDEKEVIDADEALLLIVEDNADLAGVIRNQFKDEYTVLIASNGEEGIQKAIKYVPDLIISDIMMPKQDGIQLTQKLKSDERTSHIPVILLTARADDKDQLTGIATGADAYVTKPFNKELLVTRVKKLIEERNRLRKKYSQEVILLPKEIAITSADEKFLNNIQRIIEHQLTDAEFNAEMFSKEMGMSRMQLHRKLKALLGVTTSEFIRTERLKTAAHLLKQSDANVSEIGYAVGFNDPSYFTRCFKEHYGVSPKEYTAE